MADHRAANSPWIRCFRSVPHRRARLVCFPHAGGAASFYVPLSRTVTGACDVLAVQYPGRQERRQEPFRDNVHEMADEIAQALVPWTDVPLVLLGHSMGATLAYEVTRRLERDDPAAVARLIVSCRPAPSRTGRKTVELRSQDDVLAELRRLSGTDDRLLLEQEMIDMIVPILIADYAAIRRYQHVPEPVLRTGITAFLGVDDPGVSHADAAAWEQHTTGTFALRLFPGGHFYFKDDPAPLARAVSEVLSPLTAGV
ncbi:thioesterase II family protein [Streptomyces sp. NPDC050759]|uniref:thioesterase II family protein n=1 Tax=Streptomyces sp. NPDC050759 TaxID=3365635 RepID=UPI0037BB9953